MPAIGVAVIGLGNAGKKRLQRNGGGSRGRTSQKRATVHHNLLVGTASSGRARSRVSMAQVSEAVRLRQQIVTALARSIQSTWTMRIIGS